MRRLHESEEVLFTYAVETLTSDQPVDVVEEHGPSLHVLPHLLLEVLLELVVHHGQEHAHEYVQVEHQVDDEENG